MSSLSALGEDGLLRELERRGLAGPLGDDTAVLDDGLVVTQDALVEGIHFRLEWTTWRDLGYKAAVVNLSDLAAAGAEPEALVVSLAAPPGSAVDDVIELYEGLNEPRVPVRGGDTARAERVYLSVTALGRSDRVPGRAGARPGDLLVVTGSLGGAAAGLAALERGLPGFEELVEVHNRPPLRLAEGRALAGVAHALMDLSDGIATDAARLAARSSCAVEIEVELLPLAPRLAEVGEEPFWALGEDYELLAALDPEDARSSRYVVVGRCLEGSGCRITRAGKPLDLSGWDHFRV
jgi:thiamine-monophosphate kinase